MPHFRQKEGETLPGKFMEIAAPNLAVLRRICYLRNAGNLLVVSTKLGHMQIIICGRITAQHAKSMNENVKLEFHTNITSQVIPCNYVYGT
jgi:hypothetical protein